MIITNKIIEMIKIDSPKPITCSLLIFWFSLTIIPIESETIAKSGKVIACLKLLNFETKYEIHAEKIALPTKNNLSALSLGYFFM